MSAEIIPLARSPIDRRGPRKATVMDRVRVRAFVQRLEAGEDELGAFWAVISDAGTGMQRFRGGTERPSEIVLRRKLAAMLERTAPGLLSVARDVALAKLAGLSDEALLAVQEVVTGDFADGGHARARLESARVILASLGIREQASAAASATVNVLTLGDGLRALRRVPVEVRDAGDGDA